MYMHSLNGYIQVSICSVWTMIIDGGGPFVLQVSLVGLQRPCWAPISGAEPRFGADHAELLWLPL